MTKRIKVIANQSSIYALIANDRKKVRIQVQQRVSTTVNCLCRNSFRSRFRSRSGKYQCPLICVRVS